jgi:tetrahydrodipicolinate N-succinyltransferase
MTQVKLGTIDGTGIQYIAAPEGQKVWVVYKQWPTNKIDRVVAYFNEALARAHAGSLVGRDGATIGLETIVVKDAPPKGA